MIISWQLPTDNWKLFTLKLKINWNIYSTDTQELICVYFVLEMSRTILHLLKSSWPCLSTQHSAATRWSWSSSDNPTSFFFRYIYIYIFETFLDFSVYLIYNLVTCLTMNTFNQRQQNHTSIQLFFEWKNVRKRPSSWIPLSQMNTVEFGDFTRVLCPVELGVTKNTCPLQTGSNYLPKRGFTFWNGLKNTTWVT